MKRAGLTTSFLLATLATTPLLAGAPYAVYDLGLGAASDINASGTVVGYTLQGGLKHAFSYSAGVMTDLGTLPGRDSSGANALNGFGTVVGTSFSNDGSVYPHGFRYSGGTMSDIGTLGGYGYHTYANDINNAGTIVGESVTYSPVGPVGYPSHAFRYSGGVMTDLGTMGGAYSAAAAINNSGTIVGWSDTSSGTTHAFTYSGGVWTDLGSLANSTSYAQDINDAGVVVGYGYTGGYYHGFRYSGGVMSDIGTLGGTYSYAEAINTSGAIVGEADTASQIRHAFMYQNGVMVDLAPYLATVGLTGTSGASGIDDRGDIVGSGYDATGQQHAFLLAVAVPEPATSVLLCVGLCALVALPTRAAPSKHATQQ